MSEAPHHDVPDPLDDIDGLPEELTGADDVPPGEGPDDPDDPAAGETNESEIPEVD